MVVWENWDVKKIVNTIREDGKDELLVIADFDKTLTQWIIDGKPWKSLISFLRDWNYLAKEYNQKAKELFEKYYPIEIDKNIPEKTKYLAMESWRKKHFDILVEYWLNKKVLNRAIDENTVFFAKDFDIFTQKLSSLQIPLLIISAWLEYLIQGVLKKYKYNTSLIFIIANTFDFDKDGNILWVKNIIHGMNKKVVELKNFDFFDTIQGKKNIVVMGDSLSDVDMAIWYEYENILKIGFCHNKENADVFKKVFDIVIFDDEGLTYVNTLLETL